MSGRCKECGANTVWDQDVGSAVCLECGTLADPTQSILTSHFEQTDTSGRDYTPWFNVPGSMTLRGRNGWSLGGQGKEDRDRRNTIAMHDFIRTVATRLSSQGVTPRAQGVFDQAMRVGQYRWGRKAKLTAGAALAIALRESSKSESIRDIAYLLDEPPSTISRAFSKITSLLQLELSLASPASYLLPLQTHLVSLTKGSAEGINTETLPALPAQLRKVLLPLVSRLPNVTHTASSLAALLARTEVFTHLPAAPTGCALFLLALEGELSSSLPNAGVLAQALGMRLGVGKSVVMERYKQIYDLVEEWIREVPWLDAHERKTSKGREGSGRSKVAKRVVVARGLKDVVQFQEEIWRKRVEGGGRLLVQLDLEDKDDDGSVGDWDGSEHGSRSSQTSSVLGDDGPRRKKSKTSHPKPVVEASQFLLNPLSMNSHAPSPSSSRASTKDPPDLLTHLLTADASSLPHTFKRVPTRLQLLATERGGTEEHHIPDDELFAEGELEGFMRDPKEVDTVRIALGWEVDEGSDGKAVREDSGNRKKRKRPMEAEEEQRTGGVTGGSKQINMDVLKKLLDPDTDLDAEDLSQEPTLGGFGGLYSDGSEDGDDDDESSRDRTPRLMDGGSTEEVVEEWRPMSPGGGGASAEDWYDF